MLPITTPPPKPSLEIDKLAGRLPDELLLKIFYLLNLESLLTMTRISKFYNFFITNEDTLWKALRNAYFNDVTPIPQNPLPTWSSWLSSLVSSTPTSSQKPIELPELESFKQQWQLFNFSDEKNPIPMQSLINWRRSTDIENQRKKIINALLLIATGSNPDFNETFIKNNNSFIGSLTIEEALLFLTAAGTTAEPMLKYLFAEEKFRKNLSSSNNSSIGMKIMEKLSQIKDGTLFDDLLYLKGHNWLFFILLSNHINPAAHGSLSNDVLLAFAELSLNVELIAYYYQRFCNSNNISCLAERRTILTPGPGSYTNIFKITLRYQNDMATLQLLKDPKFFSCFVEETDFLATIATLENTVVLSAIIENIDKCFGGSQKENLYVALIPQIGSRLYDQLEISALQLLTIATQDEYLKAITDAVFKRDADQIEAYLCYLFPIDKEKIITLIIDLLRTQQFSLSTKIDKGESTFMHALITKASCNALETLFNSGVISNIDVVNESGLTVLYHYVLTTNVSPMMMQKTALLVSHGANTEFKSDKYSSVFDCILTQRKKLPEKIPLYEQLTTLITDIIKGKSKTVLPSNTVATMTATDVQALLDSYKRLESNNAELTEHVKNLTFMNSKLDNRVQDLTLMMEHLLKASQYQNGLLNELIEQKKTPSDWTPKSFKK